MTSARAATSVRRPDRLLFLSRLAQDRDRVVGEQEPGRHVPGAKEVPRDLVGPGAGLAEDPGDPGVEPRRGVLRQPGDGLEPELRRDEDPPEVLLGLLAQEQARERSLDGGRGEDGGQVGPRHAVREERRRRRRPPSPPESGGRGGAR